VANRLDKFPAFLLERARYARARGITRFSLKHANGDLILVTLKDEDKIEAVRIPHVKAVGLRGEMRMRLGTTEAQLERDIAQGISSHTALEWRD
jgi:hypothetical protein